MYIVEAFKKPLIINKSNNGLDDIEKKYNIIIPGSIKRFIIKHSGERPKEGFVILNNKNDEPDYDIRIFLSVDPNDKYFYIGGPIKYYLDHTNNKLIPFAETNGGDYFCVDLTNGKVYYSPHELEDEYYPITNSLEDFYRKVY